MLSQVKSGSDVIFESSNVIQEDESHGSLFACTIDVFQFEKAIESHSALFEICEDKSLG